MKQRLINSNIDVYKYVETWTCNCSEYGVQSVMAVDDISTLPEIDPETLPIVQELRAELRQYKDLGVTPEQIALLMNFFKERTSAKYIATDMELVADSLQKGNLEKRLMRVTAERDAAVEQLHGYCAACKHYTENHCEGQCEECKHEYHIYTTANARDNWEWCGIPEVTNG